MLKEKDFLLYAILAICPLLIWIEQTGSLSFYLTENVPDGQLVYVFSKLAGLYLVFFLWAQIFVSLKSRLSGKNAKHARLHMFFGVAILVLASSHILLFFSAVTIRQESAAWGVFWPTFKDYYHSYLMVGLFAFVALCSTVFIGKLRATKPYNSLLVHAHKLYFGAIVLGYIHAIAIGTEFQSTWGAFYYSALAISLGVLIIISIVGRKVSTKRTQG